MSIQRESKRINLQLKGNYRIWESDFPFSVLTTVNISHAGICFQTDQEVPSSSSVELKLTLPKDKRISLLAKVVWSNPIVDSQDYSTGVKIMNINSDDAKTFISFYESNLLYPPTS